MRMHPSPSFSILCRFKSKVLQFSLQATLGVALFSSFASGTDLRKASDEKFIFVDGVFDLAHYGHAKALIKAKKRASCYFGIPEEKIKLIVGVNDNDGNLKAYKRTPVMNLEQRVAQIGSFKHVDAIIPNSPLIMDECFIREHEIDLVLHGDDFTPEKTAHYFEVPVRLGIYLTYPYEPGISTSDLIYKATFLKLESLLEKLNLSESDAIVLERALQILSENH